jgi:hypothetical protein
MTPAPARAICLGLYAICVAFGAWHHEPWADEAQAWMLAREIGWWELQRDWLRYEGSPGLWHTLLYLPAQLGLPYEASLKIVSGLCAVAGVALFLRYSPLPPWLTLLVPFTFFVAYQYAVVARNYSLLLGLMALSAAWLPDWHRKPLRLAAALILLSQVSLHGTIIAVGFGAQALLDAFDRRHDRHDWLPARMALAVGLVCLGWIAVVAVLMPPADLSLKSDSRADAGDVMARVIVEIGRSVVWQSVPMPVMVGGALLGLALFGWSLSRRVVFGPICLVALCALASLMYSASWHAGTLFLVWIMTLWLVGARAGPAGRWHRPVQWATAAILLLHVGYAAATFWLDWRGTYAAAREVADHLKRTLRADETLWGYQFVTIAVQPYFDRPIFANQAAAAGGRAAWTWSKRNTALDPIAPGPLCAGKPDLVLTVRESNHAQLFRPESLAACGYVLEKTFTGTLFFQGQTLIVADYLLYRRRP